MHGQQMLYNFFVSIGWEKQKKDRLGVPNMQQFFTPALIGQIWIPNARTMIEINKKNRLKNQLIYFFIYFLQVGNP